MGSTVTTRTFSKGLGSVDAKECISDTTCTGLIHLAHYRDITKQNKLVVAHIRFCSFLLLLLDVIVHPRSHPHQRDFKNWGLFCLDCIHIASDVATSVVKVFALQDTEAEEK